MDRRIDHLSAAALAVPGVEVRVVERCTSTNDVVLKEQKPLLVAAEEQTAGRGRRGRRWHSPRGAGATFSLGRRIRRPARELPALSLVAGVAAARALNRIGVPARLKWPNDLVVEGAKLGGILVETRDTNYAVIGIGINCRRTPGLAGRVQRAVAFTEEFAAVSRNEVIRHTAAALLEALEQFETHGFDGSRAQWESMHADAGRKLRVRLADGRVVSGVANGLADDGALELVTRKGIQRVRSGRVVSARPA